MALVDRLVHVVFDMVAGNGHQHSDAATAHGSDGGGVELARARATDEHSRCLPRPGSDGAHGYEHDAALQHELDLEAFEDESGASIRALASVEEKSRLLMMAAVISAAIVLHNIPEGMATYVASYPPCMQVLTTAPSPHRYVASYHSVRAGAPLAIAIAAFYFDGGLLLGRVVLVESFQAAGHRRQQQPHNGKGTWRRRDHRAAVARDYHQRRARRPRSPPRPTSPPRQ
jgi:zinc transporter ZupT